MKRILTFLLTNLVAVLTLTFIAELVCRFCGTSVGELLGGEGLMPLFIFAFIFGMAGALISLMLSKTIVKVSMKCKTIDGSEGEAERWLVTTVADLA